MDGLFENHMARLNITWKGQNADLTDPISIDLDDAAVRAQATEAVNGGLPGIDADPNADFTDFIVDRFPATADVAETAFAPAIPGLPARVMLRPKTPFGV